MSKLSRHYGRKRCFTSILSGSCPNWEIAEIKMDAVEVKGSYDN